MAQDTWRRATSVLAGRECASLSNRLTYPAVFLLFVLMTQPPNDNSSTKLGIKKKNDSRGLATEVQLLGFVRSTGGKGNQPRLWNIQNLGPVPPYTPFPSDQFTNTPLLTSPTAHQKSPLYQHFTGFWNLISKLSRVLFLARCL